MFADGRFDCCVADVEREKTFASHVNSNMYDAMCVPDLGTYLEYNHPSLQEDRKPIISTSVPAHTPSPVTPAAINNNFLHEGKFTSTLHPSIASDVTSNYRYSKVELVITYGEDKCREGCCVANHGGEKYY